MSNAKNELIFLPLSTLRDLSLLMGEKFLSQSRSPLLLYDIFLFSIILASDQNPSKDVLSGLTFPTPLCLLSLSEVNRN